jgi:hypothetical protein
MGTSLLTSQKEKSHHRKRFCLSFQGISHRSSPVSVHPLARERPCGTGGGPISPEPRLHGRKSRNLPRVEPVVQTALPREFGSERIGRSRLGIHENHLKSETRRKHLHHMEVRRFFPASYGHSDISLHERQNVWEPGGIRSVSGFARKSRVIRSVAEVPRGAREASF